MIIFYPADFIRTSEAIRSVPFSYEVKDQWWPGYTQLHKDREQTLPLLVQ